MLKVFRVSQHLISVFLVFASSYFNTIAKEYVVLLARNGGQTIRVLEAGQEGFKSKVLIDLELNFNRTGFDGQSVAYDFAFVEKDDKTLFVSKCLTPSLGFLELLLALIPNFPSRNIMLLILTLKNDERPLSKSGV